MSNSKATTNQSHSIAYTKQHTLSF
uniref:Uncharacterized protein n=1 Tax=Anguilla anguilla TaxID=7936 RepID=A0A0E9UR07_ANGAN